MADRAVAAVWSLLRVRNGSATNDRGSVASLVCWRRSPLSRVLAFPYGPGQRSVRIWTPAKYHASPVFTDPFCPLFPIPKLVIYVGFTQKL